MIAQFVLALAITAVLGVGSLQCMYVFAAQHQSCRHTISALLHLVMVVAMILMAWSAGNQLPTHAPMVLFGLAAIWFAVLAAVDAAGVRARLTDGYHCAMMAAMVWMFAVMRPGHSSLHGAHPSGMGMSMTADASSMMLPVKTTEPVWITSINLITAIGFAVAAVYWLRRLLAERPPDPLTHDVALARPELLWQVCAAAGTAMMFGSML